VHENPTICGKCQGGCCKGCPGAAFPQDFGNTPEEIRNNLEYHLSSGKWKVIKVCGCLYVRPAVIGESTKTYGNREYGVCVFLTPNGCSSPIKPAECSALVPDEKRCVPDMFALPVEVTEEEFDMEIVKEVASREWYSEDYFSLVEKYLPK
jgi:hypothetical protein